MREYQFYVVPTPIGNLSDMTFRAIEVLKSVDVIACEDSRVTQKLLNHFDIQTKLISYHKYNEKSRIDFFMKFLEEGKKVALVSDAGTPMICDPGSYLLKELIKNKISFTALQVHVPLQHFYLKLLEKMKFLHSLVLCQEGQMK